MSLKKRFITKLALVAALSTTSVAAVNTLHTQTKTVQASTTSVAARSLGIDVASYQSADLSAHARSGAKFAIVKVSEGTSYRNTKASAQVASARAQNMMPMGYHFATFSANSAAAKREANYAVASAKAVGLAPGSYLACDYESGDGNNINMGKGVTANAIIAFMQQVKAAGYKPLLYASSSVLRNNINTNAVVNQFPNSLWVASYAVAGRIDKPNFSYFPSMKGVSIWQFTDNWRGLNVDGNINVLPLTASGSAVSQAPTKRSTKARVVKHTARVYDKNGNHKLNRKSLKKNTTVTTHGKKKTINGVKYYRIGKNAYVKAANLY
ncbi:GH25 family lysozyme [Lactobacillus kitasatonis]|uniref:Lysin n=1 Tax=Lactobacillus kitasatonis DSM 16761 = JCM 1039 TaxID=1423767 RepID=A0A0R1VN44_9LACO|nr:GH25 family lysozyme [Lactobacillus kitasatonis]KRM07246.1 lysin [Lactobacillus kitasatonis DSM 16761 = JCM 1039]